MTHKKIKRYQIEGKINNDSDIVRMQAQYINTLWYKMRSEGYVPVLDLSPAWSLQWDGEHYDFLLTVHGVYYGKTRALDIYGVEGLREIPME
jgi:hypothetical protein